MLSANNVITDSLQYVGQSVFFGWFISSCSLSPGESDTGDSESESGDVGYIVREEKSYICRVRPGTFVLTNPDRLVKQIDSLSDNQRSMAFRDGSFTMDTGYAGDEQKCKLE